MGSRSGRPRARIGGLGPPLPPLGARDSQLGVMPRATHAIVGVPVSVRVVPEGPMRLHGAGEMYIRAVSEGTGAAPMLIPALGGDADFDAIVSHIDGLLLTGGRANVEPHHYGGPPFPDDEICDPARDATVLPLIRACVDAGIPVLGVCRGIQEMNVALGGSLHYRVHQVPGMMDHRMPPEGTTEEKFGLRHAIALTPGGLFADLAGAPEVPVNSLHGQGIDRLADGLVVEANAPDGLIEGVRLEGAKAFTIGVQWHAEYGFADHALSKALLAAFGDAARARAGRDAGRARAA